MKVPDSRDAVLDGENLVGILMVYPGNECDMYNVLSNKAIFPIKIIPLISLLFAGFMLLFSYYS